MCASVDRRPVNVLASASFKPKRLSSSASRMQAITHKHAGLSPDAFSMPSSAGHDTILGASASDEGGFSMSEETKVDHYPRSTEDIPVPYTSSDSFRRGRMPSTGQDSRAIALEKLSTGGHSGLPSPPGAHYDSGFGSSPTDTPYTPNMSPISPTTSPATGRAVRRQTTRKPVPSYSPSLIINQAEPNLSPQASVIATDDESSGSGASTPRGASHSREDLRRSFGHLPQLSHKASFGMGDSRPVHYLVPDPPPAAHPRR
ncbi:uncharacterized protein LAESUDRAFT_532294 [Laetiporus sulphureus 93-53]|uniref:Uncharacterized protein n=1 Tax=Laetiporus sulphureus 93-53 TaxID=1314785 RepID=A0A165BBC2_9APHY|nr:uncharacterized protein LAESUDRAFT_532294 [Laetiporus sulphureus 93-53]KZT00668.1 hypothetical protein LAESUDRAFT_532294 [Laetiporus sulphureus 93-53]